MPTLGDIAFNSWMAPVRAETEQQDLAIKKQQVVANQLSLTNQIQQSQEMQKIWGGQAPDASAPEFMPKLLASAQAMATHGNPQGAASMLSSLSLMNLRQQETKKNAQQVEWHIQQQVGSILGGVTDDASEAAAVAELPPEAAARLQLTGSYAVDAPKIRLAAQQAMSRAQQLAAQDRSDRLNQQVFYQDSQLGFAQQRIQQANSRLSLAADQAKLREREFGYRQTEDARKDARAQEGLQLHERMAEDRSFAYAGRVQPSEVKAAENIFSASPLTAALPENIRKAYANVAAARAKQEIRRKMQANGDAEYLPQDFDSALMDQMEEFSRQGLFNPKDSGGLFSDPSYTFIPPKAPAAQPPAKKEADTMKKMESDPRVQAILNDSSLSSADKTKKIHALGY